MFVTQSGCPVREGVDSQQSRPHARPDPAVLARRGGLKYKMSNLQAAIGCAQMRRIDELIAGKRRHLRVLRGRSARVAAQHESGAAWHSQWILDAHLRCERLGQLRS